VVEASKRFKFGWFGDGGLGERLIQKILAGRKTATCCPSYDPDDADLKEGDQLELTDKHGRPRARLVVTKVELRSFESFDDALAQAEGGTLEELKENMRFANGREIKGDEEMRVLYFKISSPEAPL